MKIIKVAVKESYIRHITGFNVFVVLKCLLKLQHGFLFSVPKF
jgi:hypothetical protein